MSSVSIALTNRQLLKALTMLFNTFPPAHICEWLAEASEQSSKEVPLANAKVRLDFAAKMERLAKEEQEIELIQFMASVPNVEPSEAITKVYPVSVAPVSMAPPSFEDAATTTYFPKLNRKLDFGKTLNEELMDVNDDDIETDRDIAPYHP